MSFPSPRCLVAASPWLNAASSVALEGKLGAATAWCCAPEQRSYTATLRRAGERSSSATEHGDARRAAELRCNTQAGPRSCSRTGHGDARRVAIRVSCRCKDKGRSLALTATTTAVLTLNSFEKGKDDGGPSECDNAYHSDKEMVVALSTGWFKNMARCGHCIKITANGKSVYTKVVDECNFIYGCDDDHSPTPPCANNIVDASPAVWNALGLDQNVGMEGITWSDE
ncbi:putative ripening-related protein 1 [Triticum dicoccoides]|uniref:putative ripening-related protein 1 n=1 Tax=Triticum dicoccoides TaxID=85692 RepID=UPI001891C1F3|nr:putative ripening-related protein 1 [Triticum dicoccoides]